MRANLRSKPIESTLVDYSGNIVAGENVTIKRKVPTGSETVDSQKSDETGFFQTIPLPSGVYDLYYQNTYTGSISHFHDISIPLYIALDTNIKPKAPFEVLRSENNLMNYAFFLQIENVDVSSNGNTYPIYDFNPNDFDEDMYGVKNFFDLDSVSRITKARFDVEFFIPITSQNKTSKTSRFTGVPAIRFFSESQLVVPVDYYGMLLKNPSKSYNIATSTTVAINSGDLIVISGTGISDLLRELNFGDVLKITTPSPTSQVFYGIVDNISSSNEITLERFLSSRYNSNYDLGDGVEVSKVDKFDGLRSLANSSVFDNFSAVENAYAQDVEDLYKYYYALP